MQVLRENPNGAHHRLGDIKVYGPLNDAIDHKVNFSAEDLVERLLLAGLRHFIPGQDQLSIGTLEH